MAAGRETTSPQPPEGAADSSTRVPLREGSPGPGAVFKRRLLLLFAARRRDGRDCRNPLCDPADLSPEPEAETGIGADVSLQEVDGGPDYYARFPSPPNVESYFPIGVWLESVYVTGRCGQGQGRRAQSVRHRNRHSRLPLISANGLRVIAQQSEWRTRDTRPGADAIAGWELYDEIDMVLGPGGATPRWRAILATLPDDGRLHTATTARASLLGDERRGRLFRQRTGPRVDRRVLVHRQQPVRSKEGEGRAANRSREGRQLSRRRELWLANQPRT